MTRDTTACRGNGRRRVAFERPHWLRGEEIAGGDLALLAAWRRLGISDHAYYRCTRGLGDGDVHQYFGHWDDPCDALVACMHVLEGLGAGWPGSRQPIGRKSRIGRGLRA